MNDENAPMEQQQPTVPPESEAAAAQAPPADVSPKSGIAALLLCILLGTLGVHRFYVGKIPSGIIQLLTAGGCFIWWIIDLIMIAMGKFTDVDGKVVKLNT